MLLLRASFAISSVIRFVDEGRLAVRFTPGNLRTEPFGKLRRYFVRVGHVTGLGFVKDEFSIERHFENTFVTGPKLDALEHWCPTVRY